MAELNREHLIEIRIGSGDPQSMRVKPGQPLGPTQIGSASDWRLDAPGVAPEHAELYFDGSQLFVRSVSPGAPVLVAGRPVPGVWTPLEPLSEIMLGGARLWFGPDVAGAPAERVAREELLEDDDNVETSVADTSARPWGDVSALVQRGMDASRSQAAALGPPGADPARSQAGAFGPPGADPARSQAGALGRLPPPEPPPPKPAPSFWPTSPPIQSAPPAPLPPPPDAGAIGGPSKTSRSEDSGMTRIEPVEDVQRRHELSTSGSHYPRANLSMSGSNYPRADLSTSGSHYPRANLSTSGSNYPRANLSTSGSNYPRMAPPGAPAFGAPPPPSFGPPPPSSDGRATLSEPPGYGGTEVLQGSPMPPLRSAPPGAMPSFGAPPGVPSFGAPPPSSSGMPPPLDGGFARQTGMHPQASAMPGGMPGMPGPRFDQPITPHTPHTPEGLARADTGAKKGAWAELSGPKKALVFLSPLIVGSVLVLFMGEELGIDPKPGRPQARPTSAATSAAAARPTGAPTTTAAATAPPSAAPSAVAAAPDSTITPPDDSNMGAPPSTAAPTAPRGAPPPPEPATRTPPGSRSLQRRAADAVAAGAYAQAAELYEQLAKENPNKPAYAEAAAILRAKAAQK